MMNEYKNLLLKAVEKQFELAKINEWKNELLEKAPPVLWFGNMLSSKPKIVTIGANPSREEFLAIHRTEAEKLIKSNNDLINLPYLQGKKKRFRALKENETLSDVLNNDELQNEIIESYNRYFFKESNPYGSWFGKKGKIEGFLNGMDASYYEKEGYSFTAVHTDFFPFSTISNFGSIESISNRDLFNSNWSQSFLNNTLKLINPKIIIVFGSKNTGVFRYLFREDLYELSSNSFSNINSRNKYNFYKFKNKYLLIMVSTYLADARGVTTEQLNNMGQEVIEAMRKLNI